MAIYETVVILDSLLPAKEIDDAVDRFSQIITENGGTIRKVDKWGKRRLAYEIQKKQYGFYVAIEFEGEGNIPKALQSEYNYTDPVLRYLTYRYDKHQLKAMAKAAKMQASLEVASTAAEAPAETPAPEAVEEKTEAPAAESAVEETPVEETAAKSETEVTEEAGAEEENAAEAPAEEASTEEEKND